MLPGIENKEQPHKEEPPKDEKHKCGHCGKRTEYVRPDYSGRIICDECASQLGVE